MRSNPGTLESVFIVCRKHCWNGASEREAYIRTWLFSLHECTVLHYSASAGGLSADPSAAAPADPSAAAPADPECWQPLPIRVQPALADPSAGSPCRSSAAAPADPSAATAPSVYRYPSRQMWNASTVDPSAFGAFKVKLLKL